MKHITAMYFSPTGTGRKITKTIAQGIGKAQGAPVKTVDLTVPKARSRQYAFTKTDILVLGYPVYAGRVPGVLQDVFRRLQGDGACAILAGVYGNRAYEDALLEAQDILSEGGFKVIGAGAFIGEHSYSEKVAAGRPDEADLRIAADFADRISRKWMARNYEEIEIKGSRPYKEPMGELPFSPKTADICTNCGICAALCPVSVISQEDPKSISKGCILCAACIKGCPEHAKYFDAEPIQKIKTMLETKCMDRKEPELFL